MGEKIQIFKNTQVVAFAWWLHICSSKCACMEMRLMAYKKKKCMKTNFKMLLNSANAWLK